MLYIAPSIILDAAQSRTLDYPVFLSLNCITGITADHEDANYPASNLGNPQTSSVWKSGSTLDQSLTFDVASNDFIDSVCIARHNWGSGQIAVTILGITAEPGAVYEVLAELSPGTDAPIMAIVDPGMYVGIRIDLEPGSVAPQAAVVSIGTLLRMANGVIPGFTPPTDGLNTERLVGIAENGDFLGDIVTSQRLRSTPSFRDIDGDWYRSNMRPFVQSQDPFFFAWAPIALPSEVAYSKFEGSPVPSISRATGQYDIDLPIVAVAL